MPDGSEEEVAEGIQDIFKSLKTNIEFVRSDRDCSRCPIQHNAACAKTS